MTTDAVGGVWQYSLALARGLVERYDSRVMLACFGEPSREDLAEAICGGGVELHLLDLRLEWMPGGLADVEAALVELARVERSWRPDLIHGNQFCCGLLETGIPKVVVAHSDVLGWIAWHRGRPRGSLPNLAMDETLEAYRNLVIAGLKGASAVVCPSHFMARSLLHIYHFPSRVIYNGLWPDLYISQSESPHQCLAGGGPVGLCEGQTRSAERASAPLSAVLLHDQGGSDACAGAHRRAPLPLPSRVHPSSPRQRRGTRPRPTCQNQIGAVPGARPGDFSKDGTAVVAGRLWDEAKNAGVAVEAVVGLPVELRLLGPIVGPSGERARLPGASNARYLGSLSWRETRAELAKARFYLATSSYEPFGLAALEAAFSGCTLVANDAPFHREVWGDAAAYYPLDDAGGLRHRLEALLQTPAAARELAEAAYARAVERYTAERMVTEYWKLYESLGADL